MKSSTRWILAIVGLLGGNLVATGVLLGAARGASSSRVIPSYYDKAVHYDDVIDQAARNRALGWRTEAEWKQGTFVARVFDRTGAEITDARVDIVATPRAQGTHHGLHDLAIAVTRGTDVFVEHALVDVP
jgi:nitrogen fixation protein FixH